FIVPPSFEELQARLRGRGTESPEVIAERLKTAQEELSHHHLFDYVVVNDDVDRAAKEVLSIISAIKNEKE
ncbi:MAG: guanylate kinase, partial [Ruminococcus sp.]|nr:guanylate kinase [Ruminococcus sp.]